MGSCWPRFCPVRVAAVVVVAILVPSRKSCPADGYESNDHEKSDKFLHDDPLSLIRFSPTILPTLYFWVSLKVSPLPLISLFGDFRVEVGDDVTGSLQGHMGTSAGPGGHEFSGQSGVPAEEFRSALVDDRLQDERFVFHGFPSRRTMPMRRLWWGLTRFATVR